MAGTTAVGVRSLNLLHGGPKEAFGVIECWVSGCSRLVSGFRKLAKHFVPNLFSLFLIHLFGLLPVSSIVYSNTFE